MRRYTHLWPCALLIVMACDLSRSALPETQQLLTPEVCAEVRYLAPDTINSLPPIQMSPDGNHVAFVLQVPNLSSNENKDELFINALDGSSSEDQTPVLVGELIGAVRWFPDNRHLAALIRRGGKVFLVRVDRTTKTNEVVVNTDGDVTDYSIDTAGDTIAIGVRESDRKPSESTTSRDDTRGYRINADSVAHLGDPRRKIFVLRGSGDQHWTPAQQITFVSPLSGRRIDSIVDAHDMHASISPNGRFLVMDNVESFPNVSLHGEWARSPQVEYMRKRGFDGLVVSYLYDLETKKVSMPLKSPIGWDTLWAPDSNSYAKVALAPVGSKWEAADAAAGALNDHITHLFVVDIVTGEVSEVLRRAEKPPIAWTDSGDLLVRTPVGDLMMFRKESDRWTELSKYSVPLPSAAPYSPIASDGHRVVMEYENTHTPPQLVAFDLSSDRWRTIAKLNPKLDDFVLPLSETISWSTATGFKAKGLLLLPPDYDPHRRYPVVIEDGSILYSGEFVCDSGAAHVSSFARGILADAGIVYLTRYWPDNDEWENNYYPKGYPGYLAEAAFKQDLVESAIRYLNQRRIADPARVGLIGFSRGGWYVEYALTHSEFRFRAATATDNVQYSMGEYWYWNNDALSRNLTGMYGGPPYGKTLNNWLDYSISFNLDRIRTPLLMEVMGYGKSADDPSRLPDNLAVHNEVFIGLSTLKKPVELYYYPDEQHQPEHPRARVASLQRNIDWFRFWLQGYERPTVEAADQYSRWESMRGRRTGIIEAKRSNLAATSRTTKETHTFH